MKRIDFQYFLIFTFTTSFAQAEHHFNFEFGDDTLLKQLNWAAPSQVTRRVVWDEYTRFNTNGGPPSSSWIKNYFHSPSAGDPALLKMGWRYNLAHDVLNLDECEREINCQSMVDQVITTSKADIDYSFEIEPSLASPSDPSLYIDDHIRVRAESEAVRVVDDIEFLDDSVRITMTVTNQLNREIKALEVPFYLGGLMIGNYNFSTRKINAPANLSRLRPFRGGMIEHGFSSSGGTVWDMYPYLSNYSPVSALWGTNIFALDQAEQQTGEMIIGAQLLTHIELPTEFGTQQVPYFQHSPSLNAKFILKEFQPNESRIFTFAFSISEGDDNWQAALQPYKDWFTQEYGRWNPSIGRMDAIPNYCPSGPIEYAVGANVGLAFDWVNGRYNRVNDSTAPGGSRPWRLRDLFSSDYSDEMRALGIERFGIWHTTLNLRYLASSDPTDPNNCIGYRCELSGNTTLLDPNIDASLDRTNNDPDTSVIRAFTDDFEVNNMSTFWYTRPCVYSEGADILYDGTGNPPFIRGTMNTNVDLRTTQNKNRALGLLDHLIARGVKGIYFDAMSCRGDTDFIQLAKQTFQNRYGIDLFVIKEGAVDRDSLWWPQIPILKAPEYNPSHSVLMDYLVPDGTYYGGEINSILNSDEILDILQRGYQVIPESRASPGPSAWLCEVLTRSYENYHQKWENYGQALGCPEPYLVPPACQNYPDIYYTVQASADPQGSISPSGTVSVLEGSNPFFTITPQANYRIKNILLDGVPVADPRQIYWIIRISRNHTLHVEFEEGSPPSNNQAPTVDAGINQSISLYQTMNLNGFVVDDGLPAQPGYVTVEWSQISGPGITSFDNASRAITTAHFSQPGTYILNLSVNDGERTAADTVTITVLNSDRGDESRTQFIPCQNPQNPQERSFIPICYNVGTSGNIKLTVYSRKGETIKILREGSLQSGWDTVYWDTRNAFGDKVASGIYMVVLESENEKIRNKIVVIK